MKYVAFVLTLIVIAREGLTPSSAALIAFIIWSVPLNIFRTRFRKIVYNTSDWKIAVKPVFIEELKALFGITQPKNSHYKQTRNFYRIYLAVFLLLYITWTQLR